MMATCQASAGCEKAGKTSSSKCQFWYPSALFVLLAEQLLPGMLLKSFTTTTAAKDFF